MSAIAPINQLGVRPHVQYFGLSIDYGRSLNVYVWITILYLEKGAYMN